LLIVDTLLVGGIKFVLGKVAAAVEAELNDDSQLREELLAAQMRLELGEISETEFAAFESDVLARLREIRERKQGGAQTINPGEYKVTGIEASTTFDSPEE
jgi:hypothetical protein